MPIDIHRRLDGIAELWRQTYWHYARNTWRDDIGSLDAKGAFEALVALGPNPGPAEVEQIIRAASPEQIAAHGETWATEWMMERCGGCNLPFNTMAVVDDGDKCSVFVCRSCAAKIVALLADEPYA